MTRSYKILPASLHGTADAAVHWFKQYWGVSAGAIAAEAMIHPDIGFRPTLVISTPDHHILCVEVSESLYSATLDSVILDCRSKGLPVKLCVAVPKGITDPEHARHLRDARRAGVGILEVDGTTGLLDPNPLSQSLTGVRPIDLTSFPKALRLPLQQAEQQFKSGHPAKACSAVYDELESEFRRFAKRCEQKSLLTAKVKNISAGSWARIIDEVDAALDRKNPKVKPVTHQLLMQIQGVTPFRNQSGHKPASRKDLIRRDRELRTRFEGAVDLLHAFLKASKI